MDAKYDRLASLLEQRQSLSDGDIDKIARRLADRKSDSLVVPAKDDSPNAVLKKLGDLQSLRLENLGGGTVQKRLSHHI